MTETSQKTGQGISSPANRASMTHRERVQAALKGAAVDRPPVSFWLHFPGEDHTAQLLADSTVRLQQRFDLDVVKLMPTGMYAVVDYGVTISPSTDGLGTTQYASGPVHGPHDWARLPSAPADRGELGKQVEVVRRVRAAVDSDTPIIQTIYSPLSLASKLVGSELTPDLLDAEELPAALERIAADVVAFAQACRGAGADGFFFASQLANASFSRDEYERLGVPYDLAVLEALRPDTWFLLLHLHGEEPFFDLANRYPVDAVSWEDRETTPAMGDAVSLTSRCLVGGMGRHVPLVDGTSAAVMAEAQRAMAETRGHGLILAPGCTIPVAVPAENLQALRDSVGP